LNNTGRELHFFRMRLSVAGVFVLVCFSLLVMRLLWLQVFKHEDYAAQAEDNRISIVPITPNRGLILDRNGVVLAQNYSAYTLEITPSKINGDLETLINELSLLVSIEPKDRKHFKKLMEDSKKFESVPIRTRLTDAEVARFTVQRYRFPGVEIQARLFRQYPLGEVASHVIGYIGRLSQSDVDKLDEDDEANYYGTDYIGKEGVEKSYEKQLHGTTGYEEVEVSAGGRAVRTLSRNPAIPGNNLILSIDIELQKIVEEAFGQRRGALVAIEPSTGDILAYVSKPNYDPNLFVEGIDQQSWDELNNSLDRPLVNRPISGSYPPGSTYKPFMALAALELGKRTPDAAIMDPGYFNFGNHRFRDDKEGGHGSVNMYQSIVHSCDTYYYMLANDLGVDAMHDFMKPFGFGQVTGIDLAHEKKGLLPSTEWKRNAYKTRSQPESDHGGAAVAHEWQRHANHRQNAADHADINKHVGKEHHRDCAPQQTGEHACCLRRNHPTAADQQQVQGQQEKIADQTEFFRIHGKNKVCRPLRNKMQVGLRTLQPALAHDTAGTDRNSGLNNVKPLAKRIGARIDQRHYPLPLIIVQQGPYKGQAGSGKGNQPDNRLPR